jgi:UDP-N-acetyl-D-galactosamine dehydrogenase
MGHQPQVILSGRETNEGMAAFIAERLAALTSPNQKRLLILGLTFKENVPDLRNTKVVDLMTELTKHGFTIDVHDPHADPREAKAFYDIDLVTTLDGLVPYDMVLGCVPHQEYKDLTIDHLNHLTKPDGCIADLKALWRGQTFDHQRRYWSL